MSERVSKKLKEFFASMSFTKISYTSQLMPINNTKISILKTNLKVRALDSGEDSGESGESLKL